MDSKDVRRLRELMERDLQRYVNEIETYGPRAIDEMFEILELQSDEEESIGIEDITLADQYVYRFWDAIDGLRDLRRWMSRAHREITMSVGQPTSPEMLAALDEADKNVAEGRR